MNEQIQDPTTAQEDGKLLGADPQISRRQFGKALGLSGLALAASAMAARVALAAGGDPAAEPNVGAMPPTITSPQMAMPPHMHMKHDMTGYGIPTGPPQQIAMLVYPNMTALDLVGPNQILSSMGNVQVHLVWKDTHVLTSDAGIPIQPTTAFADCPDDLTVLFVPGGSRGTVALMDDQEVLGFLSRKGKSARYVTSVCTGSLLLGAAGLLKGYKATSHWAFRDVLPLLGATPVAARVVEDGNRITGAGVTAGLDFGLHLVSLLRNDKHAKSIQLTLEYDPQPPFHAGTPTGAGADITNMLRAAMEDTHDGAEAAARRRHIGSEASSSTPNPVRP